MITHFCFRCVSEFFSSRVSGHQRGGLSVGDFLGSWRAVPLSTFPPVTWPVRFFTMTYCVDFLLFPPGSTQVFDIKLLQNVFLGDSVMPLTLHVIPLDVSVSVWLLRFLFALFLVTWASCRRTA